MQGFRTGAGRNWNMGFPSVQNGCIDFSGLIADYAYASDTDSGSHGKALPEVWGQCYFGRLLKWAGGLQPYNIRFESGNGDNESGIT